MTRGLGVLVLSAGLLGIALSLLHSAAADGRATAAPAAVASPSLLLVGPSGVTLVLTPVRNSLSQYTTTVELLVENSGAAVKSARLTVAGDPTDTTSRIALVAPTQRLALKAYGITAVPATILEPSAKDSDLTFVLSVESPPGVAPVTETFKLVRNPSTDFIWTPVALGFAYAIAVLLLLWLALPELYRLRKHDLPKKRRRRLTLPLYTGASWSFGGSWVTLTGTLGAVLTTVLASTGLLSDALPGLDVQRFVPLNLIFLAAVLAAPLVYSLWNNASAAGSSGTVGGLSAAMACTLFGVAGELLTMAELAFLSNAGTPEQYGIGAAIGIAMLLLGFYAVASLRQLARPDAPTGSTPAQKRML